MRFPYLGISESSEMCDRFCARNELCFANSQRYLYCRAGNGARIARERINGYERNILRDRYRYVENEVRRIYERRSIIFFSAAIYDRSIPTNCQEPGETCRASIRGELKEKKSRKKKEIPGNAKSLDFTRRPCGVSRKEIYRHFSMPALRPRRSRNRASNGHVAFTDETVIA